MREIIMREYDDGESLPEDLKGLYDANLPEEAEGEDEIIDIEMLLSQRKR